MAPPVVGSLGECQLLPGRTEVWPRPGPTRMVRAEREVLIAGHARAANGGEELFVVRLSTEGQKTTLLTHALEAPLADARRWAPPSIAFEQGMVAIAYVDARARIRAASFSLSDPPAALAVHTVAEGADLRFPPAVALAEGKVLVAWTARGEVSRVRFRSGTTAGFIGDFQNLTPESYGGSAPVFVVGSRSRELVYMDARAGFSPIVRVGFDRSLSPGTPEVTRSVGTATEPTRMAAVQLGASTVLGYTVVGNLATTAVGLVHLENQAAPLPIVPGTGYGHLGVDVALVSTSTAVFAVSAPTAAPPASPRRIQVRTYQGDALSDPIELESYGTHPAIAVAADGLIVVTASMGNHIMLSGVRCE